MKLHNQNTLVLIPARGGSKGLPGKNIMPLANKPMLAYSIEAALQFFDAEHVCVSTDDNEIAKVAIEHGASVPFIRPKHLATDTAGSYEVLLHAVDYFSSIGINYETLVLLQPTSPFRTGKHIREALELYNTAIDMVVSVCKSNYNPYYNLVEKNNLGWLELSKKANFIRRQDCPDVYYYNGAVYIINIQSLRNTPINKFERVVPYEMNELTSVDIDTQLDFDWANFLLKNNYINI
jgi:CMP-N,N'-diacetyllegionaminic acid synthase